MRRGWFSAVAGCSLHSRLAYSILMPALHVPILVMLLGLVLRGVCVRISLGVAKPHHHWWDRAFFWGLDHCKLRPGLCAGWSLAGCDGEKQRVRRRAIRFGSRPSACFCGAGVVAGYALLGACWLNFKNRRHSSGPRPALRQRSARSRAGCFSGRREFVDSFSNFPRIAERWFTPTNLALLWASFRWPPRAAALFAYESLRRRRELAPFIASIALFLFRLPGAGNFDLSLRRAADRHHLLLQPRRRPTSIFGLMGVLFVLPLVLVYTGVRLLDVPAARYCLARVIINQCALAHAADSLA